MTEKLFWEDQNMREFFANVVEVNGNEVILDKTAFYPRGGGQPADTGVLVQGERKFQVTNVEKSGDNVVHYLEDGQAPEVGGRVQGFIDWDRRHMHMRYHTAIHILDGIVTQRHSEEGLLTGGQIYTDRARIDFDMQDLDREKAQKLIDEVNAVIAEDLPVYSREMDSREALSIPNLSRTLPGRELLEKLDKIRIIVIEGLDEQADGGTHVSSTHEVGRLVLQKLQNKGRRNKRMEFRLEDGDN